MMSESTFSEDLLAGLTPEQREAVTSPQKRILVRATAGSGKTHVLTLRIQRRVATDDIDHDHVLAMTFTRKAADELSQRLYRAGVRDVRAGTFHRAALSIVNQYRHDRSLPPTVIEPNRRKLVTELIAQMNSAGSVTRDWQIPQIEQELAWSLSLGLRTSTYVRAATLARRQCPLPLGQFAELIDRYIGLCQSRAVYDFDLLLSEATRILSDEPAVRAAFRYRNRALFVDETQDMNPLQFALLREMAGDDPDLFAVGDPNQSIYGFNGANPTLLEEISALWPDTVTLDLTRNHRSTAHIIMVANTLLEAGARGITPARDDGELPNIQSFDTDVDEAARVASWLQSKNQPGSPWKSMAVLARTNAQIDVMASALEHVGVPFERRGAEHSPASDLTGAPLTRNRVLRTEVPNAVALSTIHRAKGLEWQHVAAIGWSDGLLPFRSAHSESELAEEQRLAYVALTRAEISLLITWSRGPVAGHRGERAPSRFLAAIEEVISSERLATAPLSPADGSARAASLKAKLISSRHQPNETSKS
ncbi:MAG: ATP-dependent helicase [Actinomycetota bacterium]